MVGSPTIASSVPGSTAVANYWSSTTFAGFATLAWFVGFDDGGVGVIGRTLSLRVRAVRGGR
jgi:hypothetical protein